VIVSATHQDGSPYRFCIAPMMDWTDRHERYLLRLISSRVRLYTEMVTTGALIHGDRDRFLGHADAEHPLGLQLGGSDPADLTRCAVIGQTAGFDEININVGCPSDRVQAGRFGACLMLEPDLVATCFSAMQGAVSIPVTVKCRLGVDEMDRFDDLIRFVDIVAGAGCTVFIVHARKAWLSGLSPRENREVPPLQYERVYALKERYPELTVVINGGITRVDEAIVHLKRVDGVMVGREAYQNPWSLARVDETLFDCAPDSKSRFDVLERYKTYMDTQLQKGVPLKRLARHLLGLFQGQPGARIWRRALSDGAFRAGADLTAIESAEDQLDAVLEKHIASAAIPKPQMELRP
jgi:tRNA-dihydrouridine synthase A